MKYTVFVLLFFTHSAFAQKNDFGNGENPATYTLFSTVQLVRDIPVNDGFKILKFDSATHGQVGKVRKKVSYFIPDTVYYFRNYTHMVMTDSSFMRFDYLNGDSRMVNMGKTIFIIARDDSSFAAIFVDKDQYGLYYSREPLPLGTQYTGFTDARIRGVYPNLDQIQSLDEALFLYLPQRKASAVEGK